MSKPIRPQDVGAAKAEYFPSAVFDAFNAEIAHRYFGGLAVVKQGAVVDRLVEAGLKRSEIYSSGWLNVEDAYREAGWVVRYEKAGFNENGDSIFEFRAPADKAKSEPDGR